MIRARWLLVLLMVGTGCGPGPEPADEEADVEEAQQPGEVTLTAEQLAVSGVVVDRAHRTTLSGATVIPAEIRLDPTRTAHVAPLVGGRLRDVHVRLGDSVEAGDVLGELASADAGDLAAAMADARARLAVAEAAWVRLQALGPTGVTSQRSLLEAESDRDRARAELTGLTRRRGVVGGGGGQMVSLVAPLAGVVVDVHAVPGESVEAGEMVFVVADVHHVWAVGRAPEIAIGEIREGLPATLRLHAYPGERFEGTVALLSPMLDEVSRTLDVRVELDDPSGRLRAGLFGSLALGDTEGDVVVVPDGALARLDGADVVFVPAEEERTFRVVPVAVGHRSSGLAEIVSGLADGDAVVTVGAFLLKSQLLRAELQEEE